VVLQQNQFLLRFLKLRVVVNGHYIYALVKDRPIVIDMPTNPATVVVTDGFHITEPVELTYSAKGTRFFKVACVIEDGQLLAALLIMGAMYLVGATSSLALLQLLSIGPVWYFLFLYYIKRKKFIQIRPA